MNLDPALFAFEKFSSMTNTAGSLRAWSWLVGFVACFLSLSVFATVPALAATGNLAGISTERI